MSNEKPTVCEQADKQQLAEIASGLAAIEIPKPGLGAEYCIDCGIDIPMGRREAYNTDLCIDCKVLDEKKP